ncbi:MAG: hypothetical protein ACK4JY_03880 [Brevundimonas sp.]|uniref:hypothetical protein n=1 Tax=Brevundimonas sp. TaxID=1871086 RepID=UPI003919676C
MTSPPLFPLAEILGHPREFFEQLVRPAVEAVPGNDSDTVRVFSAFILLHSMKDWAARGEIIANEKTDYFDQCPFAQIVMEIATGAKHQTVSSAAIVADPSVLRFRKVSGGYGKGAYGLGAYGGGVANFQVEGRRLKSDAPGWHGIRTVLREPCEWWAAKFGA